MHRVFSLAANRRDLLFPSESWQVSAQAKQIIANFAKKLTPSQEMLLPVSGYTDNAPIEAALP